MDYKQALEQVKQKYNIVEKACDMAEIVVNKNLDSFNLFYIAIADDDGQVILNDLACTCEVIDLPEQKFIDICNKHNVTFDDWHLSCKYESIDSLENYISCIQNIVDEFEKK